MTEALRTSIPPLPKKAPGPAWKTKLPTGVISQDTYESTRGRTMSWKPKSP